MRYAVLAISLFLVSSVVSTIAWMANTPELAFDYDHPASANSPDVANNNTTFVQQVRASLNEEFPEPPEKQRWLIQSTSAGTGLSYQPEKNQRLLLNAAYNGSYGVNEEFLKRACADFTQRSP